MNVILLNALEAAIKTFSESLQKENHSVNYVLEDASVEDEEGRIYARFILGKQ